jgi:hypothetical protein
MDAIHTDGPRIPLEAECAACADAQFKLKHDKRKEYGYYLKPDYERNLSFIQSEFEKHLKLVPSGRAPQKSQR